LRDGARRRGARRDRRAAARAGRARARDARAVRALLPRDGHRGRAAGRQAEFLEAARERSGLELEVLSGEQEARYGYLAAVNSTTLSDGVVLDLGGGSMQLPRVEGRRSGASDSWPRRAAGVS